MKGEKQENILLAHGIYKVDDVLVGLTRDGGQFTVEYTHRPIVADGDRGLVKGRVTRDEAKPKLTINHLEVLTEFAKFHTGVNVDTTTKEGYTTVTGTGKIDDENDYHKVEFIGATKNGRDVHIIVYDAINLENIDWALKDKDEIIDTVTYEATYDPQAEDQFKSLIVYYDVDPM